MQAPNAEQIEIAADQLSRGINPMIRKAQLDELHEGFAVPQAAAVGVNYPLSSDFEAGYEMGLQTARAAIAGSTALILKGVNPDDVL